LNRDRVSSSLLRLVMKLLMINMSDAIRIFWNASTSFRAGVTVTYFTMITIVRGKPINTLG